MRVISELSNIYKFLKRHNVNVSWNQILKKTTRQQYINKYDDIKRKERVKEIKKEREAEITEEKEHTEKYQKILKQAKEKYNTPLENLREQREFRSPVFIQHTIPSYDGTFGGLKSDTKYLNIHFKEQIGEAYDIINKIKAKSSNVKIGYYIQEKDSTIYSNTVSEVIQRLGKVNNAINYFTDLTNEERKLFANHEMKIITKDINQDTYNVELNFVSKPGIYVILQYKILVQTGDKSFDKYAKQLLAFLPNKNKKYHEMTACSTTKNKLCIWESYYYLYIKQIQFVRNEKIKKKQIIEEIKKELEKENKEVIDFVKKGKLVDFLTYKSKELKQSMYVQFFKPVGDNFGFEIKDDEVIEIKKLENFNDKKVFLYDNNHVAPRKNIKLVDTTDLKKQIKFVLKPTDKLKDINIKQILAYDIETFTKDTVCVPYCLCLSNGKDFYGKDLVKEFCDYLDSIKTDYNTSKTNQRSKIPQILIYGFNNSRFDNTFIVEELKKRGMSKYTIMDNDIKCMSYYNIHIFDLSLYYAGSLDSVSKAFKLQEVKGVFPYKFPNENNLNYVGEVPDIKYWKSEKDRDVYIKENGNIFNLKEYTIKYCLLDTKLTEQIARKHLSECEGEINGKKFDVRKCPTGAKIALNMFNQVFQNITLYESTEQQQIKERLAYKGGRTEVFKKESPKDKTLYYYDINSSYPNAMQNIMPYNFKKCLKIREDIFGEEDLIDHNLYLAKCKYIGNDNSVIPNLLIRSSKNDIIAIKNTDYQYQWGIELKEAIRNNFEVKIKEINEYEGKEVFGDFARYFYNERLKIKKTNPAKANFYKLVMNSLYGKFGQRIKENIAICNTDYEVQQIINNPKNKLVKFDIVGNLIKLNYVNEDDEKTCVGSLVRFASYITAIARTNLAIMMRDVGHDHIYYCDTDSVFTDKKPSEYLLNDNELGKWKLENECINGKFIAPKSYIYEECGEKHMKGKGVPNRLLKPEYYDQEKHKVDLDVMFYRKLNEVRICEDISRTMQPVYNKRIWNGNNSQAYENYDQWFSKKYGVPRS